MLCYVHGDEFERTHEVERHGVCVVCVRSLARALAEETGVSAARGRDELLDVAAVAMRLYFGEIDTEWRSDFESGDAAKGGG